jgi:hypothetical protein
METETIVKLILVGIVLAILFGNHLRDKIPWKQATPGHKCWKVLRVLWMLSIMGGLARAFSPS